MNKKQKARWLEQLHIAWYDIGFGVRQYTAMHPNYFAPVGVVWTLPIGGKADMIHVLHSYTNPHFRRLGVRTAINKTIASHAISGRLSHHPLSPPMYESNGNGYTYDKKRRDWYKLTGKK